MDQMLRTDDQLRVEEVQVPANFVDASIGQLIEKSRDYILLATHERGQWVFNPADEHLIRGGTTLVLMATPNGRSQIEKLLQI